MTSDTHARPFSPRLVSVVVPAYNEEGALEAHLGAILAYAAPHAWNVEILVVDDGSRDGTAELAERAAARHPEIRLLRQPDNTGKGAAVRRGLGEASGDIRGFTDADASTDIAELERLLPAFGSSAQVVIGSRARRAEGVSVDARLHRRVIGRTFNTLLRVLLDLRDAEGSPIADTQCGFKWLTADACEAILPHVSVDGFAFDVEFLYLANRLGLPIREVPVNWIDRGSSSVNLLTEPAKMLAAAMAVVRRHRRLTA